MKPRLREREWKENERRGESNTDRSVEANEYIDRIQLFDNVERANTGNSLHHRTDCQTRKYEETHKIDSLFCYKVNDRITNNT